MMVDINTNQNDGGLNEVPVKFGYEAKQISSTDVPPDAKTQLLLAGLSNSQDIGSPHGGNTSFQTYNQTKTLQCPFILHPCTDGSLPIDLNPSNMVQGSLGPTAVQPVHPKMAAFPNSFMYTAQHNGGHNSTKMIYPTDNNLHIPAILGSEEMMPNAMEQGSHRSISAQPAGAGMADSAQGFMNTSQHIGSLYSTNCSSSNFFGSIPDFSMTGQLDPSTMGRGLLRSNLFQPSGVGIAASTTGLMSLAQHNGGLNTIMTNINNPLPTICEAFRPGETNTNALEQNALEAISAQLASAVMAGFTDGATSTAYQNGGQYNLVTNFPFNYAHPNIPEVSRPGEMNPSTSEHSSLRYISMEPAGDTAQNIGGSSSLMMGYPGGDDHNHDANLPSDTLFDDIVQFFATSS